MKKQCPVCKWIGEPVIHYDYSFVTDGGGELPYPKDCHCPNCKVMFMSDSSWRSAEEDKK